MRKYELNGLANVVNWVLVALHAAAIAGCLMSDFGDARYGRMLAGLNAMLLVGVLFRFPLTYLGVATFALLALASSLNAADLLTALIAGAVLAMALYVRSRLRPRAVTVPHRRAADNQAPETRA